MKLVPFAAQNAHFYLSFVDMSHLVIAGQMRQINAGTWAPLCPVSEGDPAALLLPCVRGRGSRGDKVPGLSPLWLNGVGGGGAAVSWESMLTLLTPHLLLCTHHPVKDLWSRPVIPVLPFSFFLTPHREAHEASFLRVLSKLLLSNIMEINYGSALQS